jgi:hypothetical protein
MLLLLLACAPKGADDTAAPVDCTANPSSAWSGGAPAYEERTDAWGLTDVRGARFAAADLDGDGFPDLLVNDFPPNADHPRDDLEAGLRLHRILMNRPGASGGRIFVDETESSGLIANRDGGTGTSHTSYIAGDVDNDGDLDVFAAEFHDGASPTPPDCSELFLNDGDGTFTMANRSAICDLDGYPLAGSAFADVNADGRLDLWTTGFYETYGLLPSAQDQLFLGAGDGTFTNVTEAAGLELRRGRTYADMADRDVRRPAYGATACDVNGDTLPDLIATNYGRSWNQLWVNQGDGTFVEDGERSGFASDDNYDYTDNTRYACWYEAYGGSGDPEPTTDCIGWDPSYWTDGYDDLPARNNGNSFTTVCADVDNDGDNDLYTTEIVHKWAGNNSDATTLLFNDGTGTFARAAPADIGMDRPRPMRSDWNEGDLYAAFADFDNDGWKDVFLVSSDYPDTHLWLWRQIAPGQFEDVSDATGMSQPWPAGIAMADFDADGDVDLVTGSSLARSGTPWTAREVHLYENVAPVGNWLRVRGAPVGARVEVDAGGVTQTQEVVGGYGTFGIQNDTTLSFGLGDTCAVDAVRMVLPGGESHAWPALAGNTTLELAW